MECIYIYDEKTYTLTNIKIKLNMDCIHIYDKKTYALRKNRGDYRENNDTPSEILPFIVLKQDLMGLVKYIYDHDKKCTFHGSVGDVILFKADGKYLFSYLSKHKDEIVITNMPKIKELIG